MILRVLLVACLTAAAWVAPSPAGAHAVLVSTEPADGVRLEQGPSDVHLMFNEPVAPVLVRVLDGSGVEIAGPERVGGHGEMVHIALPAALPEGGYVVSYRVISVDGHPVVGSVVFVVGDGAAPAAVEERSVELAAAATAATAIHYLGLFVAAGGVLFVLLVTGRGTPLVARFRPGLVAGAFAAAAAGVLRIGLTGADLSGGDLGGLMGPVAWRIGLATSVAVSMAVAVSGLVLIGFGLATPRRRGRGILLGVGAAVALLSLAASGHAATAPPRWLSVPVVALHGAAAAYWVGAFWPLSVALRVLPVGEVLPIVQRFARLAIAAVAVLVVAGAILSALQLETPTAVVATVYGRVWAAKMALVLALLALAALNRQVLTPALAGGLPGSAGRLRRSVAAEAVLALAITGATAAFALGPPPRALSVAGAAAHDHAGHIAAEAGRTVSVQTGRRTATVSVVPAMPGRNRVTVRVADAGGAAVAAKSVAIELALPALGVEPVSRTLEADGDRGYVLADIELPIAGLWAIRLDLLVSDFEKQIIRAEIPIGRE